MWVPAVTKGKEPYLQDKSDIQRMIQPMYYAWFPPVGYIFIKGSHVPDLVALVKCVWSCCGSKPCAEANNELCAESTQSNMTFKQKAKEIKQ